jgi:hypothetical protein
MEINLASDRISKKTAKLVHFPAHHWYHCDISQLLNNKVVQEQLEKRIPINEPLMKSIHAEGFKNPVLLMKSGWAIAGGQRLRVCAEILKSDPNWNCEVEVCQFENDEWNMFYLWGDKEFVNKAVAIYFQMVELVFKSLYYKHDKNATGVEMTYYEDLGDKLKWNHNDS